VPKVVALDDPGQLLGRCYRDIQGLTYGVAYLVDALAYFLFTRCTDNWNIVYQNPALARKERSRGGYVWPVIIYEI
jgi:hypothetical protein